MHPSFDLTGRVAVITGGVGLLGRQHARAISLSGGIPVLVDLPLARPDRVAAELSSDWGTPVHGFACDITSEQSVSELLQSITSRLGAVHILINNAANNPKQEDASDKEFTRLENFPLDVWQADLAVGITGAFLMSKAFGGAMAAAGGGVILNISSDLGLIAPDQRLYRKEGRAEDEQPVKPVSYSVVKTALIGLTRYLATYWAAEGVRVNAICPGGVSNGQPDDFVERLTRLIPMGRMANLDEYQGAVVFLCSDASSYMTGAVIAADGGRSCW